MKPGPKKQPYVATGMTFSYKMFREITKLSKKETNGVITKAVRKLCREALDTRKIAKQETTKPSDNT